MTNLLNFSATLPDLIDWLRSQVSATADAEDITARELADCLDLTWSLAERWRIERDTDLLHSV